MNVDYADPTGAQWEVSFGGDRYSAPSAYDILALIGERSYAPLDHKFPKRGLAYRTFVQYRILIDADLPDDQFLAKLAEFGVIKLRVRGTLPSDVLAEAVEFSEQWYGPGDKMPDIVSIETEQ